MSQGYVYILSNPAMPGLVKIGRTTRSAQARANELYQTGVPAPFKVECEVKTPDCDELEAIVHGAFLDKRYANDREFFEVEIDDAKRAITDALREQVEEWLHEFLPEQTLTDTDLLIDPGNILLLASDIGADAEDVAIALNDIRADEFRPALDRWLKRRAGRKANV